MSTIQTIERLIVDTSVLVAVIVGEAERANLIERTRHTALVAPTSVHWEVGNALAAMLKRRRAILEQVLQALMAYDRIQIRLVDVSLADAMQLADKHNIYAYDAYLIACARQQRCSLLTLDLGLARAAAAAGVNVVEVSG